VYLHVVDYLGLSGLGNAERCVKQHYVGIHQWLRSKVRLYTLLGAVMALLVLASQPVRAAGVGAADVRSVLGDKLSIHIPIFNVSNPDALQLSVRSDMFGGDPAKKLKVELETGNNQLAARVSTDWEVMEPYIEFSLELQDGGVQQNKDFIVLLDFNPSSSDIDPLRVLQQQPTSNPARQPVIRVERTPPSIAEQPSTSQTATTQSTGTMGPYDYAEAGNVPARFGAVLDGQSLWRVARRINGAMGVSVEQMMVALYNANRSAFLTSSIDSLKAGSYLTIPDQETVSSLTHSEAERRIGELSGQAIAPSSEPAALVPEPVVTTPPVTEPMAAQPTVAESDRTESALDSVEVADEIATEDTDSQRQASSGAEPLFVIGESDVLTDLELSSVADTEEAANTLPSNSPSSDTQEQQSIINSLSKTIGDLMRDNVDKEQRLQIMDERLKALEEVMDNLDLATATELAAVASPPAQPEESGMVWWLWLLPFGLAGASWFGYRYYLDSKAASRDLFVETTKPEPVAVEDELDEFDEQPKTRFKEFPSNTDFSPMRAHKSRYPEEDDDIEGVSYQEIDEGYGEPEMKGSTPLSDDTIEFDTTNIATFPQGARPDLLEAVEEFIAERDFVAACGALEKARGNELDEPNYHFQMLRILLEKNDEHGFYEYFNTVENKFVDVDRELKMDLANLVSRLNQQG
jgi:FimV-like protein